MVERCFSSSAVLDVVSIDVGWNLFRRPPEKKGRRLSGNPALAAFEIMLFVGGSLKTWWLRVGSWFLGASILAPMALLSGASLQF